MRSLELYSSSFSAPRMEVSTAPSMSIISISASVLQLPLSVLHVSHVNLGSDIFGDSRRKIGKSQQSH